MISPRYAALITAFVLAGCSADSPYYYGSSGGGQAQADQQTREACRARAEQVYNQQNRAEIFAPPAQIYTPASGSYAPGVSDRGLSQRYAYETMVNDCIRNTGAAQGNTPAPAAQK